MMEIKNKVHVMDIKNKMCMMEINNKIFIDTNIKF
jgi:hypothetical protein